MDKPEQIQKLIIDRLFKGDIAGNFEYNDVREVANKMAAEIGQLQSRIAELEKALRKIKYFTEDSGYGDPGEIAAEALEKGKDTTCQ